LGDLPVGRFVEPIEKIGFYVQGPFDENFRDGGRSMRGFDPSGKSPHVHKPSSPGLTGRPSIPERQ
jgi:hypothetical protein